MHEMRRHSLGGSGVDISRIGLGGYELGPEPDEEPDAQRAAGVIGTAIEGGVNWLDTSENYLATHNERSSARRWNWSAPTFSSRRKSRREPRSPAAAAASAA